MVNNNNIMENRTTTSNFFSDLYHDLFGHLTIYIELVENGKRFRVPLNSRGFPDKKSAFLESRKWAKENGVSNKFRIVEVSEQ